MKNKEVSSTTFLAVSLIIFSVIIPFTQNKIDDIKERRETYFKNLLNAEFQRVIGVLSVDFYTVIGSLKQNKSITDTNLLKSLDKIQEIYLERAAQASANSYFLQTEPVTDDRKPDKKRYDEIRMKIKEGSKTLELEANNFLIKFNQKYINDLNLWNRYQMFAYIAAIALHVLGVWLGFISKNDKNGTLTKEVRGLISRINILIKNKNRNT